MYLHYTCILYLCLYLKRVAYMKLKFPVAFNSFLQPFYFLNTMFLASMGIESQQICLCLVVEDLLPAADSGNGDTQPGKPHAPHLQASTGGPCIFQGTITLQENQTNTALCARSPSVVTQAERSRHPTHIWPLGKLQCSGTGLEKPISHPDISL